ncbi:DMT family protein, partial [Klebsiella pneumoniae]|uniref:DMT family protein n=2 Tax=Pseudomonadota TaxID=1224 RepID=UPI00272FD014
MHKPLLTVIVISWGIAFVEYCLAVPANRIGFASGWSAGQLKVMQEAIALVVFGIFMVTVLGEPVSWRHLAAFACIMAAVGFLFVGK